MNKMPTSQKPLPPNRGHGNYLPPTSCNPPMPPIKQSDNVNKPAHYADKNIEVIEYIKDTLTAEQFEGYCMGNVHKYISRYKKKNGLEDLKKAQVYLQWAIESYK